MNINAIFDAISKASSQIIWEDKAREKRKQIRDAELKRCGNCFHWMKTSCVPEKKHKQFKSCNSFGCKDFSLCPFHADLIEKFRKELSEIELKLYEMVREGRI